jgi:ABC-2 type transport system ATP-binding protein
MGETLIKTERLRKVFGDFTAVDDISFEVYKGEVFGILGPNGAGKTTLIKMLSTLLHPTSGRAFVAGFNISERPGDVRKNIGMVFQEPTLDIELTARENLDFHARLYGMDRRKREERIKEVLEIVDLGEKADELVKKFSGGMQRRLEIARGLMHSPKVLFLDEPTLGLDAQTRRKIWEYINQLKEKRETTIILTTHYIEEAESLCDRVAIIDHGRIIAIDTPGKLKGRVGEDTISLVADNLERLAKLLEPLDGIRVVKVTENLLISVSDGERIIPEIFSIAQENNIKISSINLKKSTLEDVFILMTGRKIRDNSDGKLWHVMRTRRR